jgi:NAD(P)-dependent dehydrogenase (short-subunit alcohol dehydrogenase family)
MSHPAIQAGNVAVITGGASGIGLAVAENLVKKGLKVCLADRDESALEEAKTNLNEISASCCVARMTDVSKIEDLEGLKQFVGDELGTVSFLMNNAGVGGGGRSAYQDLDGWRRILDVNLFGVVNGLQTFLPEMIASGQPGIVVNTGSKQGITNPPGGAAYNVSKAGIRAVTEHLAHELRNIEGCEVTAHLLVPGFTYTGMIRQFINTKPPAAWVSSQVADFLFEKLSAGEFYVICPDNDVTPELDAGRMRWNTEDIIQNRPALSRWHPDYADQFAAHMKPYE